MTTAAQAEQPFPPRYWWLKRILAANALLLLVLAGLWLWWSMYATRQLAAARADLIARGQPVFPEDLNRPTIPDEINAVYYLNLAIGQMGGVWSPSNSNLTWDSTQLPWPAEWRELAAAAVEADQAMFPLVRHARQQPEVDWGLNFQSPMDFTLVLPPMNSQRALANQLGDAAVYQHFTGNDAESLELIRDVLFQADTLNQQPLLISHLVATGFRGNAVYRVQIIAVGLTLEDAAHPTNPDAPAPATREQVQHLTAVFLDDSAPRALRNLASKGERISMTDMIEEAVSGSFTLRPMFRLDMARTSEQWRLLEEANEQLDWPAARQRLNLWMTAIESPARALTRISSRSHERSLMTDYRMMMERRMAAISLAVWMYHNDQGLYPQTLDELVPHYLPQVPADPFDPDGAPLRYMLAAGGARPIVWSVGEDGVNDTPDESVLPSYAMYGWQARRLAGQTNPPDQWRDLSAWQDPNPPADEDDDDDWPWPPQ